MVVLMEVHNFSASDPASIEWDAPQQYVSRLERDECGLATA
jgi:hypothetical protein